MRIEGAVALITGGGGMLGSATAARMLDRGVGAVVIADLAIGRADELRGRHGDDRVRFAATDVTDEPSVQDAVDTAADSGPLRIVVNCAGAGHVQRTLGRDGAVHELDTFRRLVELNLVGTFNVMAKAAAVIARTEPLEHGERGVIVNTSSLAGLEGSAGQIAYGAAKAGVAGLTLPGARDLAPVGIRVVTIAPGGMVEPANVDESAAGVRELLGNVPHPRRFGLPEEYALLVTQLIENPYLNGAVFRLDGGARLGLKY